MNSDIRVRAFAKINLSLRVLGTRADGYHDLRTVFQSIALHDTLTIRPTRGPFSISLGGDGGGTEEGRGHLRPSSVPLDQGNLVWRAAEALWTSARRRGSLRGVSIDLVKRIPVQAGLGGGSSDAAATLRGLARLWRVEDQCVRESAVQLGADVPFFLEGGTVLGLDRGDVLFPLIDRPRAWVVLVVPPFGVSTPEAYRWWDQMNFGSTSESDPKLNAKLIGANDLQAPVVERHPEIGRLVRGLTRAGAACAAMSGSGSAVFGLFPTRTAADRAARALDRTNRRVLVTRTLTRAEHIRLAAK
jgi:4-diphosphocytidyl-2-C-methyl-D-erythritol kinase